MARALALGGCGGAGRHAVRTLLGDEAIEAVAIADKDGERAAAFASECGPRARPLRLDVADAAALRAAMESADIVVNAVGPFFRFGVPILGAAIDAGRHYVDICDDWAPTLAMLDLDARARERGVTAIVGMGITPGVSNLLAALAIGELDAVEEVVTGWDLERATPDRAGPGPSAATLHGVEQLTGKIRLLRGGRLVDEPPVREVRLDYPGLGPRRAWTIGHPEPVTLPRTFASLRESANVMTAAPATILGIRALRFLVDRGLLSARRAASVAESLGGPGGRTPRLSDLVAEAERRGRLELPPIFALARGTRAGEPAAAAVTLLSAPAGGMGGTTGVPLGLGARLLAAGEVARRGVLAPEAAFAPRRFLDRLAPLCDPPRPSGDALVCVTRSWAPADLLAELRAAAGA